jgi:hypothetical protein
MPESLTVAELVRHFADYVDCVVYRRESCILVRGMRASVWANCRG